MGLFVFVPIPQSLDCGIRKLTNFRLVGEAGAGQKVGLERERADLLVNKSANATKDKIEVKRLVRAFLETFEGRFKAADIYQKKELIRMVVEQIVVDKEQGVVRCYIKQVPPIGGTEGLSKHQIHVQSVAPMRTLCTQNFKHAFRMPKQPVSEGYSDSCY